MNRNQQLQVEQDDTWVKIEFWTPVSSGRIIIKTSMFDIKKRKLKRIFKGLDYRVSYNYTPTEQDHDEILIQELMSKLSYLRWRLHNLERHYQEDSEEWKRINEEYDMIVKQIKQIKVKYKWN